jgi:putative ABC transport system permease protein
MHWDARIRSVFARAGQLPDDDVIEELAQHARAMYDAARADGLSRDEANQRIGEQLDRWRLDAAQLRHKSRRLPAVEPPAAAAAWFTGLAQDLRYAARLLRRQRRFTVLASLTMAVGIAATTVLFSVAYGVLWKPLPWQEGNRRIVVKETRGGRQPRFNSFSNAAYVAWRDSATTIESIAAWSQRTATLSGTGDPDRIRIVACSASLFTVLGARPLIGSLFDERDELEGNLRPVVLSEGLWRERFGAETSVLGRLVQLDGESHTIVGVLPETQAYPDRRTRAWVPFHVSAPIGSSLSMFNAIARLRPGATAEQAASEGTARGRFAADTGMTTMAVFGGSGPVMISAVALKTALTADVQRPLIMLMAAVILLLLTATGNVAGLQLARGVARRREMAIRAALGAGTTRVIRQLLAESVLLGLTGGAAGTLLAWLLHRLLPAVLPADFPRLDDLGFNAIVILFAASISVLASIVFAVLPATGLRRVNLVESLNEDGTAPVGAGRSTRVGRARLAIIATQVAIACLLLVGASLLGRSFLILLGTDRGYDPSGLVIARLSLPESMYTPQRRYAMLDGILERMNAIPAITRAAFTSELPLTAGGSTSAFTLRQPGGTISVQASPRVVSPGAFSALGMRIVAGRGFTEFDTDASTPVVVVNRAFVRRYLEGNPLDAKLPMGAGYTQGDVEAAVIGVVDDVRYLPGGDASQPEMYYSFRQFKGQVMVPVVTVLVRGPRDPSSLAATIRASVRDVDGTLVPEAIMTMEDRLLIGLARPRLYTILVGGFAVFALVVAAVGLFGVLSQTVVERSREIAVRSALGARPKDIVRLVVRQGLAITAAGLIAGLVCAGLVARSLSWFLYGITPYDRLTYLGVPLILLAVAMVACLVPARRAARLDPVQVLRST